MEEELDTQGREAWGNREMEDGWVKEVLCDLGDEWEVAVANSEGWDLKYFVL